MTAALADSRYEMETAKAHSPAVRRRSAGRRASSTRVTGPPFRTDPDVSVRRADDGAGLRGRRPARERRGRAGRASDHRPAAGDRSGTPWPTTSRGRSGSSARRPEVSSSAPRSRRKPRPAGSATSAAATSRRWRLRRRRDFGGGGGDFGGGGDGGGLLGARSCGPLPARVVGADVVRFTPRFSARASVRSWATMSTTGCRVGTNSTSHPAAQRRQRVTCPLGGPALPRARSSAPSRRCRRGWPWRSCSVWRASAARNAPSRSLSVALQRRRPGAAGACDQEPLVVGGERGPLELLLDGFRKLRDVAASERSERGDRRRVPPCGTSSASISGAATTT